MVRIPECLVVCREDVGRIEMTGGCAFRKLVESGTCIIRLQFGVRVFPVPHRRRPVCITGLIEPVRKVCRNAESLYRGYNQTRRVGEVADMLHIAVCSFIYQYVPSVRHLVINVRRTVKP